MNVRVEITGMDHRTDISSIAEGGSVCVSALLEHVLNQEGRIQTFDESGVLIFDSMTGSHEELNRNLPLCHVKDGYTVKVTFPFISMESEFSCSGEDTQQ